MAQSRMRIALIAPLIAPLAEPHLGGVQTFLVDLARGLTGRGHGVTVFAARGSRVEGVTVAEVDVDAAALSATLVRPGRRPAHDDAAEALAIEAFAATAALIGSGEFDVVHNHAFDVPAILHAATLATPVVHTLHMPADARIGAALAVAATGANPPLVAGVSEAHADAWRRLVPVDCVLRPGLLIDAIPWRATSTSTRLLFAGRFSREKGAMEAVEIARLAGRRLLLCGPGYDPEYAARVRAFVRDYALNAPPATVDILPALERRTLWIEMGRSAAVICAPAWEEPFGLVAAEANACGTPVVGFRRGGPPRGRGRGGQRDPGRPGRRRRGCGGGEACGSIEPCGVPAPRRGDPRPGGHPRRSRAGLPARAQCAAGVIPAQAAATWLRPASLAT